MTPRYVIVANCANDLVQRDENGATPASEHSEWANYPCLGPLSIATALSAVPGVEPVYFDGIVQRQEALEDFITQNAQWILAVCASALTANYQRCLALLRHAKRSCERIVTIIGNDHFSALSALCIRNQVGVIDYGFRGNDVIGSLCALVSDLSSGCVRDLSRYPGVVAMIGGKAVTAPVEAESIPTVVAYDQIDRHFPHHVAYQRNFESRVSRRARQLMGRDLRRGVPVEIGRGCVKFKHDDACTFCSIQYGAIWKSSVRSSGEAWGLIKGAVDAGYDYLYLTADELALTFSRLLREMVDTQPSWWSSLPTEERPLIAGYARADGLSVPSNASVLARLGVRVLMVGLDAGSPASLAAMNKPLRGRRPESMYQSNRAALRVAAEHDLKLKLGVVLGHVGMTRELLLENVQVFKDLIGGAVESIAAVDVEVLSPEPGSVDYRLLVDPVFAEQFAKTKGVAIAARVGRQRIQEKWVCADVVDRGAAISDYVDAMMPGLSLDDLARARHDIREYCIDRGVFVGMSEF
jgi:anaerobic magnesium-protoporphyrin IX monomethyl ester cyclase